MSGKFNADVDMSTNPDKPVINPITGYHVFFFVLSFFLVIIVVNITMGVIATKSWTGLVVPSSWVAGQEFEANQEQAQRQRDLNFKTEIGFISPELAIRFSDEMGQDILLESVILKTGRPAFEQQDMVYRLTRSEDGFYRVFIPLEQGVWVLSITGVWDGENIRRDARLLVKKNGEGSLI